MIHELESDKGRSPGTATDCSVQSSMNEIDIKALDFAYYNVDLVLG